MAVGTDAMECYQGEDVSWNFSVSDPNVTDIAGWDITLVVKETAAENDPALVGPATATVTGALTLNVEFNADLDPGEYVYSLRRVDSGFSWQLAHGALTVIDSAHVDVTP